MASFSNVTYHERVKEMMNLQHEREDKRLELQQQLNYYMNSDKRLNKLKASQLQSYWKKVCENEKKSQWRNEALLRDFERMETHIATLSARTEKLKQMRKQYEDYVEQTYPNWREKVRARQEMKLQIEEQRKYQQYQAVSVPNQPGFGQATYDLSNNVRHDPQTNRTFTPNNVPYQDFPTLGTQPQNNATYQDVTRTNVISTSSHHDQMLKQVTMQSHSPRAFQQQPSTEIPPKQPLQRSPQITLNNEGSTMQSTQMNSTGKSVTSIEDGSPSRDDLQSPMLNTQEGLFTSGEFTDTHGELIRAYTAQSDSFNETVDRPIPGTGMYVADDEDEENQQIAAQPKVVITQNTKELGDTQQTMDEGGTWTTDPDEMHKKDLYENYEEPVEPSQDNQISNDELSVENSIYPQADVTLDGLYNMLSAIQEALPNMHHNRSDIYRVASPARSVQLDIMDHANRGAMLSHVDPSSISAVILDQLPLVVANLEDHCLFSDKLLRSAPSSVTDSYVRDHIHPTSEGFWNKLYEHFLELLRFKMLSCKDISNVIAPLLIDNESPYEEKAKWLLLTVLENIDTLDLAESAGTTTLSSALSPRGKLLKTPEDTGGGAETDRSNDRSIGSLEMEAIKAETAGLSSLTEAAAYKRFLGGTFESTQKTMSYEDSDDSDDIENMMTMGSTQNKQKAMNLSRFFFSNRPADNKIQVTLPTMGTGREPSSNIVDGNAGAGDANENSVRSSSPSLGGTGGGYVPSGLGTMGMSTLGSSASRPKHMMGDSDTDEDIVLPDASKKDNKDDDEDSDFDFYG